jgi:hypothetical protein
MNTADGTCTTRRTHRRLLHRRGHHDLLPPRARPARWPPPPWTTGRYPRAAAPSTRRSGSHPGGGLVVATDDGHVHRGPRHAGTWDCTLAASGFPYTDISGLASLGIRCDLRAAGTSVAHVPDIISNAGNRVSPCRPSPASPAPPHPHRRRRGTSAGVLWTGTTRPRRRRPRHRDRLDHPPHDGGRPAVRGRPRPGDGFERPEVRRGVARVGGDGGWCGPLGRHVLDGLHHRRGVAVERRARDRRDRRRRPWVATAGGPASFDGTAGTVRDRRRRDGGGDDVDATRGASGSRRRETGLWLFVAADAGPSGRQVSSTLCSISRRRSIAETIGRTARRRRRASRREARRRRPSSPCSASTTRTCPAVLPEGVDFRTGEQDSEHDFTDPVAGSRAPADARPAGSRGPGLPGREPHGAG